MSRRNLWDSINKYSRSEQFQSIPHVSKQNTNCSERKLKLPANVTETFPDTSDKNASDASDARDASDASDVIEQPGCPATKTLSQCPYLLSLCHFIKRNHQNPPSAVALKFCFKAVCAPAITATSTVIATLLKWTFYM